MRYYTLILELLPLIGGTTNNKRVFSASGLYVRQRFVHIQNRIVHIIILHKKFQKLFRSGFPIKTSQ